MTIAYQPDGSVYCESEVNPERTATFPGPRNSAVQIAQVVAFFDPALDPEFPEG